MQKERQRSNNVKLNSATNQKSRVLVLADLRVYVLSLDMLIAA